MLDHIYLIVTGAGTARRVPELLPKLCQIGPKVVVIPTPNAARIVSNRDMVLALPEGGPHRLVEGYFEESILPRPPFGLCLVAPCSFNSLNKLGQGIADNLALSVVAEAIGRRTPVIVGVSVNVPLWAHPQAQISAERLRSWGAEVIDPVPLGEAITLAAADVLLAAVRRRLAAG